MYGVLSTAALARQDAEIGVRRTQRLGARWRRFDPTSGEPPKPFSFAGYSGDLRLLSDSGEVWLSKPLVFDSGSGSVIGQIEASDTAAPIWLTRKFGSWAIVARAPGGVVTVVVAGSLRITQEGF